MARLNFKFIGDFILNLFASAVTTVVTQLLLFPQLAKSLSSEKYGIILTVSGLANMMIATFGSSLNNTRLIMNNEYENNHKNGDFNIILSINLIVCCLLIPVFRFSKNGINIVNSIFIILFVLLGVIRNYGSVFFRLILNYKNILLSNMLVAVGNICGLVILTKTDINNIWFIPFALGEILGLAFVLFKTNLVKEPIVITDLFNKTFNKNVVLSITSLSANFLVYLDRLILLPLLGGEAVSIYSVASFFGKSLGILFTPLSGVLLSYYAQKNYKMTVSRFWKLNSLTIIGSILFYSSALMISKPITAFIYPTLIGDAEKYLSIANLTAIISVTANMVQPSVLKFANTYWQLFIQGIYCAAYLGLGYLGIKASGLNGFSYGALMASIIKLIVLFLVGHFSITRRTLGDENV